MPSASKLIGPLVVPPLLAVLLAGKKVQLTRLMKKAEVIPDQLDAMDALRTLQGSGVGMAMVHDEYGHLEGVEIATAPREPERLDITVRFRIPGSAVPQAATIGLTLQGAG